MAKLLGKTLLSLVAACVAHGVTLAQDVQQTFNEAVRLIRTNQQDEGLEKLREILAAEPDNAEAFATWQSTDVYVWQMLLELGGDYERVAKFLMERATFARQELSRDQEVIDALIVQTRDKDFAVRSAANATLAADHGEFAVPALLQILADTDAGEKQDHAMLTLIRIGRPALLPLIEALRSENDLLRRNAAAALVEIGDSRAAAPLTRLTNDRSAGVRTVAESGLSRLGIPAGASASELYVRDARAYMASAGLRDADLVETVWTWDAERGNAVPHDLPPMLYPYELAKMSALDAMRLDPANTSAQGLVASAYLAQAKAIESNIDDPAMGELAGSVGELRLVAAALGEAAIVDAVKEAGFFSSEMHAELIKELGRYDGGDTIRGATLAQALQSEDVGVRYAAALALAQGADTGAVPAAGEVVGVLGDAVTEEALRAVLVVDGSPLTQKAAREATAHRGFAVREAATGKEAVANFYNFPHYDVVIVSEALADVSAESVINLIRKRSADTKILLLAQSEDAESVFEGLVDGFIRPDGALTPEELLAEVEGIVESFDARRARADRVSIAAGDALFRLATASVNILPAVDELAAQLDRDDSVAIPAASALGAGGTLEQAGALAAVVSSEQASNALKTAAANAIGGILSRSDAVPADVLASLMRVAADVEADVDLRAAAVTALGHGPIDAGTRLHLAEILRSIPQISGE